MRSGSRAAIVARALEADRRRGLAERDAETLTRTGDYPDFEHLVADLELDDLDLMRDIILARRTRLRCWRRRWRRS